MWSFLWLNDIPLMMQGAQTWCSVTTWRGRMDYLRGWKGGERFKTEGTQVCLWVTRVDVWQKPAQHCKAIILQLKKKPPKHTATIRSSNLILGHISREKHGSKGEMHPNFTAALFTTAKTWKQRNVR